METGAAAVQRETVEQGLRCLPQITGLRQRQPQDGIGSRRGFRLRAQGDRPACQPRCLREVPLVQVKLRHPFQRFDLLRISLHHTGVGIERFLAAPHALENLSQRQAGFQMVGTLGDPGSQGLCPFLEPVEALEAFSMGFRLLAAAAQLQQLAQVSMRLRVGRVEPYRRLQGGDGPVGLLRLDVGVPQPFPALPVEGIQTDCRQQLFLGEAVAPLLPVEVAEVASAPGILRVDPQGRQQRLFCRFEAVLLAVDEGERAVRPGVGRIEAQRLPELLDGVVVAALFEVGDGEVVAGRNVRRVEPDSALVGPLPPRRNT